MFTRPSRYCSFADGTLSRLEIYARGGFTGTVRPDRASAMGAEDPQADRGYGALGKVFAVGYMIGPLQSRDPAYE